MTVQNKVLSSQMIFLVFRSPREKHELTYFKNTRKDLEGFVKSLSPKVKSVQFDFGESMEVSLVGNELRRRWLYAHLGKGE